MVTLTEIQSKTLEFIFRHIRDTGMPPTLREIAFHFEWKAVASAQDVVGALRKKGLLATAEAGKSRQLILTQTALDLFGETTQKQSNKTVPSALRLPLVPQRHNGISMIPVLGMVQAGNPTEGIENADKYIPFLITDDRKSDKEWFALIIEGYSMLNAGFLPGDHVLVEPATTAKNGDIVVAAVKGQEVTVKRFAVKGSHLYRNTSERLRVRSDAESQDVLPPAYLVPENDDFEPIPFGINENDRIIGVARSLYRDDVQ